MGARTIAPRARDPIDRWARLAAAVALGLCCWAGGSEHGRLGAEDAPPKAEPNRDRSATSGGEAEPADEENEGPPPAGLAGDIARINTLKTLGKIGWQDARFRTRSVLETGEYVTPAPKNPANRIFLLQDKDPTWAGGWLLIKRGPGGSGFALYDETGKQEKPVVLARSEIAPEMLKRAGAVSEVWELVRLAWPAQNRKRFFLYSDPLEPTEPPAGVNPTFPGEFPPLLLRTFPVRASNFDNLDNQPVSVDLLRNRLFDPRAVSRGPTGKRFMIDDRENPFGNLNSHDYYASTYDGFLLTPVSGRYRFFLEADSYALLLIDAHFLLDADAMAAAHGSAWRSQLSGLQSSQLRRASRTTAGTLDLHWRRPLEIELSAGLHRITLMHAEVTGDQGVRLGWQLPDESSPHLIAPDCFQSYLPALTLGWQAAAGSQQQPTPGGFVDSLQIDLIERVLVNGDPHNRVARLRAQWRPAPPADGASATAAVAMPRWRRPNTGILLEGGQPTAATSYCMPIAQPGQLLCDGAGDRSILVIGTVPDDLSDQGYLRENAKLTVSAETTFAYPGEDWTLHLSADHAYGDMIQPRLHVCFEESPLTQPIETPMRADANRRLLPEANLRINGQPAQSLYAPNLYSIDLPWNGPTRTPVRIDVNPTALIAAPSTQESQPGQARAVKMTVWIEAAGVPLDCASWVFTTLPAAAATARPQATTAAVPTSASTAMDLPALPAAGTLLARRDHWEWQDLAAPQSYRATGGTVLTPPFKSLPPRNPHAVIVLAREDPALHRRSLISGTVAGLVSDRQPEAVLFVGDRLQQPIDGKQLARLAAAETPKLAAPPATVATGPQAAAAKLARESRSGQWVNLPLETVLQANLHGWQQTASDQSDLDSETLTAADASGSVTFAIAAALAAAPALKSGNGLAVVSLGSGDCASRLAIEQTVRGLDAAIDQLRQRGYPRVVVVGPTPVAGMGNFTTAGTTELSQALGDLCRKHGVHYISAIDELGAVDQDLTNLFRSSDDPRVLKPYPQAAGLQRLQEAVMQAR